MLFLARSLEYSTRKIVSCVLMGTYSLLVVCVEANQPVLHWKWCVYICVEYILWCPSQIVIIEVTKTHLCCLNATTS